ncbi:helix-hairpin-helix domain-containing protein [Comamonas sp. JUb58]|uniref:helix-hairpin-helix domain-containing protein n=1 Tax=Comamonas sp. JUb58 TaxID=2485114 RepID=UPI001414DDA3|nr:helix-hairpin-helix domain-containing protein [Comamonas sp. JUb58]
MPDDLTTQAETPLGDLLPAYATTVLAKNGIHTVEAVRRAYPHQLLDMHGMGMLRFRQIETVLFPGKSFTPARIYSPVRHVKGSSLNGVLSPATVQVLARAGITSIEELRAMEPKQLMRLEGFGAGKLREIERVFFASEVARTVGPLCDSL